MRARSCSVPSRRAELGELAVGARAGACRASASSSPTSRSAPSRATSPMPALEPPALGLERERLRVALGQRVLDARERRRLRAQKLFDLLLHGVGRPVPRVRSSIIARRAAAPTWAGRPIFRRARDPRLNATGLHWRRARPPRRRRAPRRARPRPRPPRHRCPSRARDTRCTSRTSASRATGAVVARPRHRRHDLLAQRDRCRSCPASNEKLAVTYAALTALGPAFTIETDVLGEGQQAGSDLAGRPRAQGLRRPDALERRPDRARAPGARERDHARHRPSSATSRGSTRIARRPAGRRRSTSTSRRRSRR